MPPETAGKHRDYEDTAMHLVVARSRGSRVRWWDLVCVSTSGGVDFQACSFNHSDISPFRVNDLRTVSDQIIARRRRMHASSTSPLNPAVYGPPTAARARKLCQTSKSLEITYGR